jgi:hypothetical protein
MGDDAPPNKPGAIGGEDVAALAKTLLSEARKRPKTAAAIGIGISAVAAAMLFASRRKKPLDPKVPKGITPESD